VGVFCVDLVPVGLSGGFSRYPPDRQPVKTKIEGGAIMQEDTTVQDDHDDINYEVLFQIWVDHRKKEKQLLKNTYNAFIELYALLLERNLYTSAYEKSIRSNAMSSLNELYEQFQNTDKQIDDHIWDQILTIVAKRLDEQGDSFNFEIYDEFIKNETETDNENESANQP